MLHALAVKVPKIYAPEMTKNCILVTLLSFEAPLPRNRHEHPREPYIYRLKVEFVGYIFVADSTGLSSFEFSWWAPKDA